MSECDHHKANSISRSLHRAGLVKQRIGGQTRVKQRHCMHIPAFISFSLFNSFYSSYLIVGNLDGGEDLLSGGDGN